MKKCPVCLENVLIPVKVTSLPCYNAHGIHCFSYQRICLHCCISKDTIMNKCLFCKAINQEKVKYEIDFDYINNDDFSIYTCVYCHDKKSNHLDMAKHILKDHIYSCDCGQLVLNSKIKEHSSVCEKCTCCKECQNYVKSCNHKKNFRCKKCNLVFPKQKIMNHYLDHIREYKMKIEIIKKTLSSERKEFYELLSIVESLDREFFEV